MEYQQLIESRRNYFAWNYDKEISKEAIVEESGKKYVFLLERNEDETVSLGPDTDEKKKKQ